VLHPLCIYSGTDGAGLLLSIFVGEKNLYSALWAPMKNEK
jgi:hypothetical protein